MKTKITLAAIALLFFGSTFGQDLSKEEKKRIKDELKKYMNDLKGYKAMMDGTRNTIDSNDAEIRRLKDDLAFASSKQSELEAKLAEAEVQVKKLQDEAKAAAPADGNQEGGGIASTNAMASLDMKSPPVKGTVYKVQIGLYKEFTINKYFDQPRYIGYEDVDGMNRYIISYFPDEKVAMDFVSDVRKMGIRDAFVAKYIDGKRVYEWNKNPKYAGKTPPTSLQEAIDASHPKRAAIQ